ncbi:MAG: hypothetical protein AAF970_14000, partial [Bacteroidota bacterium]
PAVTVTIPRKDGVSTAESDDAPVPVWPLIESAFGRIGVEDEAIWDAARTALTSSDGCVVLANYLNSEAKRVPKMDYAFKVPLIVLASQMALDDDGCDCIYDPDEGAVYFETDDAQYSFHVFKDWTVDWAAIADDVQAGYTWSGIENQTWALDQLLRYIDYGEGPAAST